LSSDLNLSLFATAAKIFLIVHSFVLEICFVKQFNASNLADAQD
jgi:hypothetical protein